MFKVGTTGEWLAVSPSKDASDLSGAANTAQVRLWRFLFAHEAKSRASFLAHCALNREKPLRVTAPIRMTSALATMVQTIERVTASETPQSRGGGDFSRNGDREIEVVRSRSASRPVGALAG